METLGNIFLVTILFFVFGWACHLKDMRNIDKRIIKDLKQDNKFWRDYSRKLQKTIDDGNSK